MRKYKFDKPLIESATPPRDKNVYWVDIDENTNKPASIKEYKNGEWETALGGESDGISVSIDLTDFLDTYFSLPSETITNFKFLEGDLFIDLGQTLVDTLAPDINDIKLSKPALNGKTKEGSAEGDVKKPFPTVYPSVTGINLEFPYFDFTATYTPVSFSLAGVKAFDLGAGSDDLPIITETLPLWVICSDVPVYEIAYTISVDGKAFSTREIIATKDVEWVKNYIMSSGPGSATITNVTATQLEFSYEDAITYRCK